MKAKKVTIIVREGSIGQVVAVIIAPNTKPVHKTAEDCARQFSQHVDFIYQQDLAINATDVRKIFNELNQVEGGVK